MQPRDLPTYGAPNFYGGHAPCRLRRLTLYIAFMWRFRSRL